MPRGVRGSARGTFRTGSRSEQRTVTDSCPPRRVTRLLSIAHGLREDGIQRSHQTIAYSPDSERPGFAVRHRTASIADCLSVSSGVGSGGVHHIATRADHVFGPKGPAGPPPLRHLNVRCCRKNNGTSGHRQLILPLRSHVVCLRRCDRTIRSPRVPSIGILIDADVEERLDHDLDVEE